MVVPHFQDVTQYHTEGLTTTPLPPNDLLRNESQGLKLQDVQTFPSPLCYFGCLSGVGWWGKRVSFPQEIWHVPTNPLPFVFSLQPSKLF